ncbi:MAG: CBS domain-containing protein, partial [Pseudomonadota bacterium]
MPDASLTLIDRLARVAPFDRLPETERASLAGELRTLHAGTGDTIFREGEALPGLFVIESGSVEVFSGDDATVSHRGPGEPMGDRGLLRGGKALLSARAVEPTEMLVVPADRFRHLTETVEAFGRWFAPASPARPKTDEGPYAAGLMSVQVGDMMARQPVTCAPDARVEEAARIMRDRSISSVLVMEGDALAGIVTVHDLVNKVLAEGLGGDLRLEAIMTPDPITILHDAVGLDALLAMAERRINHLPVADRTGRIVGMVGRTDLFRQQAATASHMASE